MLVALPQANNLDLYFDSSSREAFVVREWSLHVRYFLVNTLIIHHEVHTLRSDGSS